MPEGADALLWALQHPTEAKQLEFSPGLPAGRQGIFQSKIGSSLERAFRKLDWIDGTFEYDRIAKDYRNLLNSLFDNKTIVSIQRISIESDEPITTQINIGSFPSLISLATTIVSTNYEWKNYKYDFSYRAKTVKDEILDKLLKITAGTKDKITENAEELASWLKAHKNNVAEIARIMASATVLHAQLPTDTGVSSPPEVIVGPVPLYSVQRIERGLSDRKIKYRAIGDVFLAHQKGTKDSLRIDGTLVGPQRFLFLTSLLLLQMEGESTIKNFGDKLQLGGSQISSEYQEKLKNQALNYEFHQTFPIITDFTIMSDMFLQTLEWHRSIEDGTDVIKYHLLFRKYEEPNKWVVFEPIFKNDDQNQGIVGAKTAVPKTNIKWWKRTEYWLDFMWKMKGMYGELYPRTFIGFDKIDKNYIDREAVSNLSKIITSYQSSLLGFS